MELTIELTNLCKNKCIHCSSCSVSDASMATMLPAETAIKTVRELKPDKTILSGGEPFLHPDVDRIITEIKKTCPVLAVNTSSVFYPELKNLNIGLIDEFYVSFFCIDNGMVTRNRGNTPLGDPLFLVTLLNMYCKGKTWFNTVILFEEQVNDLAMMAYAFEVPVHVLKYIPHGRREGFIPLPVEKQRNAAMDILDQLDPSRLDERIPPFLVEDGYDDLVVAAWRDEIIGKMKRIHPRCKISHSLLEGKCRSTEKRTLLPDGRLIGCVAGKGIDERFDVFKVCNCK